MDTGGGCDGPLREDGCVDKISATEQAASQESRPGRPAPVSIDYPPVRNGVDYLASVVQHLGSPALTRGAEHLPGPRSVKYAVLHLQAAVEVLLKARLQREHWSLVFSNPATATRASLADFSFESCTTNAAVERLRNIAQVPISAEEAKALKDLARDRNALQHYGFQHNVRAVESRAAIVLDFLVRFLDTELLPKLGPDELASIHPDLEMARTRLTDIKSFVRQRMNRLRGNDLAGLEHRTAHCNECQQDALVVDADGAQCHFCSVTWTVKQLLVDVWRDPDPQGSPGMECPSCHAHALLDCAVFIDPSNNDAMYCLACTKEFDNLGLCKGCGCFWPKDDENFKITGQLLCADCQDRIRREEDEKYWQ